MKIDKIRRRTLYNKKGIEELGSCNWAHIPCLSKKQGKQTNTNFAYYNNVHACRRACHNIEDRPIREQKQGAEHTILVRELHDPHGEKGVQTQKDPLTLNESITAQKILQGQETLRSGDRNKEENSLQQEEEQESEEVMEIRETLLQETQETVKKSSLEQKPQEDVISTKNKMAMHKRQVRTRELWKKLRKNCSQNVQEKVGKTKIQPQTEKKMYRKNRGSAREQTIN